MKKAKTKKGSPLWWVGYLATIWWAVSGLYVVLVVWLAKDFYAQQVSAQSWTQAIKQTFNTDAFLSWLFWLVMLGWLMLGIAWFRALKRARISYKAGLKDLFLTLR